MYTGTLIEDLLATVNRAEKSARVLAAQKRQLPLPVEHQPCSAFPAELEAAALAAE